MRCFIGPGMIGVLCYPGQQCIQISGITAPPAGNLTQNASQGIYA